MQSSEVAPSLSVCLMYMPVALFGISEYFSGEVGWLPWEWCGRLCVICTPILAAISSTSLLLKAALLSECTIFAMPKIINTLLYRNSATVSAVGLSLV